MSNFELHKMVNESIRDTIQSTEQAMRDLGLYVCVRPVDFGNAEDKEPDVEISSLSWHLGNVEDALLDKLEIHPANERLRNEFKESALLQIDASKDAASCQVDLYDIYVRNNYLDDLDDLAQLAKELETKLNAFAMSQSREAFEEIQKDTKDIFLVDDFFQTVSDICQTLSDEELSEYDTFYDFAVQQAARETLSEEFHPHILNYSEHDLDADVENFRYTTFEKLLQKKELASWEDLGYSAYMKACNAQQKPAKVGTVRFGGVHFDAEMDASSIRFTPKIPVDKRGKTFRSFEPIEMPLRLEPPIPYDTFQYRAEHLMSKGILDHHLASQAFSYKNSQKEKKCVMSLLR